MARIPLLVLLLVVASSSASGTVSGDPPSGEDLFLATQEGFVAGPAVSEVPVDTVWFGGDDGNCIAFRGGIWDWDTIVSDTLQCWRCQDPIVNPSVYFYWVTADSFAAHVDPYVPIGAQTGGMLWCGIHEDEAQQRGFLAGMGYQNYMCQRAFSPEYPLGPPGTLMEVFFSFFNDTESEFDYTHLYILCYDSGGEPIDEYLMDSFTGVIGSHEAMVPGGGVVPLDALDPATETIQLEFRMVADEVWSDEDGFYDSICGPFGVDDFLIQVNGVPVAQYNFDDGPQGWTFAKCPAENCYMSVIPQEIWQPWLDDLGLVGCPLGGNALSFVDLENSPCDPPGLPVNVLQMGISGPVPRSGYGPPAYDVTILQWGSALYLPPSTGARYRVGYMFYPYTTPQNPNPHWSPRMGDDWLNGGEYPWCGWTTVDLSSGQNPIPVDWDSMKVVYEVYCSCDFFGIPPSACTDEGNTHGTPLLDHFRVGLTQRRPMIELEEGHLFHDGFGQHDPTYLAPWDCGNANITYDLSGDDEEKNDWLGDSAVVVGPTPQGEHTRWLVNLCFKIARKGAFLDRIPGYNAWKARLGGDPEQDFVCVLMDSVETWQGAWPNKFVTYFHEDDPGFNPDYPDLSEEQEILPDNLFSPGTQIEYYYASYWYNGGVPPDDYYVLGPFEFEILPGMRLRAGELYAVDWPCVLYVDAYNRDVGGYMGPVLEQLGIEYDEYDYLDTTSPWHAPMKRSYGGTCYNPGGYGNNGCTTDQLVGYRLILVNTGTADSCFAPEDFDLFQEWLEWTDCDLLEFRRGIIFNGDRISQEIADHPIAITLGATYIGGYDYTDDNWCVDLIPPEPAIISVYGNQPGPGPFSVVGVREGDPNAFGNLCYQEWDAPFPNYVEFAEVAKEYIEADTANWKSLVDGFSWHRVSEIGCHGEHCSSDSACVARGIGMLLDPILHWMLEGGADPFTRWWYPCEPPIEDVDEEAESRLSGPVNYLYATRPNPSTGQVGIDFRVARAAHVRLHIYDVAGRVVRILVDGKVEAGKHTEVWDGTDDHGQPIAAGIFWVQLRTQGGYVSSKRMLVLR